MKKYVSNQWLMFIFGFSLIVGACSKEDDGDIEPQTENLEEVTLSLAAEGEADAIEVPEAMSSSEDTYAQMAVGYITMVNQIGSYFTFFKPPAGAEKSNQPITASNARTAASQKEYLVYTWSSQGYTVAYQLSDEGDKYVWEIFWKQGEGDFQKYVYAEESKTKKQGMMKIYDIFTGGGGELYLFSWDKQDNGALSITGSFPSENFYYTVSVNPDASGSVEYVVNDERVYMMTWTGEGDGTWAYYEDGEISLEGTWDAV